MNKCERCQIRWERDQAMEQLEEHHIPFGCIADDVVEVVRCKDCSHTNARSKDGEYWHCVVFNLWMGEDFFCKDGDRRTE